MSAYPSLHQMLALAPKFLLTAALAVAAIILHELAHGYAAWALGDTTARRAGRLSPNPLRHIDRFGTLILPGFLLLSQLFTVGRVLFMFGWAKPVPVDPTRFRHPRQMMALVAVAGPVMNFSLAFLGALLLRLDPSPAWVDAASFFIVVNLVLGLFNLLPVPPLDGGRIAVGVLPWRLARVWARTERYGILIVLALLAGPALLGELGIHVDPIGRTLGPAVGWAYDHVLMLAGVPISDG